MLSVHIELHLKLFKDSAIILTNYLELREKINRYLESRHLCIVFCKEMALGNFPTGTIPSDHPERAEFMKLSTSTAILRGILKNHANKRQLLSDAISLSNGIRQSMLAAVSKITGEDPTATVTPTPGAIAPSEAKTATSAGEAVSTESSPSVVSSAAADSSASAACEASAEPDADPKKVTTAPTTFGR